MLFGNTGRPYEAFLGVADTLDIPFVNWDFSYNIMTDRPHNQLVLFQFLIFTSKTILFQHLVGVKWFVKFYHGMQFHA